MNTAALARQHKQTASLQKTIGIFPLLVFGFGSIIGTAWVVLLGLWLRRAGPGGAMIGIALGGGAMMLIAAMYAELGSRFPQTGGEVTYINAVFGRRLAFVVGWLLTLAYLSALVFEGVALSWLLGILFPAVDGHVLYVVLGEKIGLGGLLAALAACATIAFLNWRGAQAFVRFQNTLTAIFLAVVLATVCVELGAGSVRNIAPVWPPGGASALLTGIAWVFGCAPMMFNSFQSVLHAIEERSEHASKDAVVRLCVLAVAAACAFYLVIVFAATTAAPWRVLATSDLPAVAALAHLPWSGAISTALLLALVASLLKAWSSVFMCTVRLLLAQAREGMIPAFFGHVNPRTGAPDNAVFVVAAFNVAGLFLGKGILEPIVNTTSVCIALIYALICVATAVSRRRPGGPAGFRVPGGLPVVAVGIAASLGMAAFALLQPAPSASANGLKWVLLSCWALLGFVLHRRSA